MDRESAEALMAATGRVLAKFDRLTEKYGTEPPMGSVVRWQKVFGDGKVYSYAAIHTENGWYTTGPRSPKRIGWEPLIEWIDAGGTAFNFAQIAGPFPIPHRVVTTAGSILGPFPPPFPAADLGEDMITRRSPDQSDDDMLDDEQSDGEPNDGVGWKDHN
jgi:hypothetical protein